MPAQIDKYGRYHPYYLSEPNGTCRSVGRTPTVTVISRKLRPICRFEDEGGRSITCGDVGDLGGSWAAAERRLHLRREHDDVHFVIGCQSGSGAVVSNR